MSHLKNTFILTLIVLSIRSKAQISVKSTNFTADISASQINPLNHQNRLNKNFKIMFNQERQPLTLNKSLKSISPYASANGKLIKAGLIDRLIKSNLKLSFRISNSFNMMISCV